MNRETPLKEVAHLLPSKTAQMLMYMSSPTQLMVLTVVRDILTEWEESDVCLDPITLETVLHSIVRRLAMFSAVLAAELTEG